MKDGMKIVNTIMGSQKYEALYGSGKTIPEQIIEAARNGEGNNTNGGSQVDKKDKCLKTSNIGNKKTSHE